MTPLTALVMGLLQGVLHCSGMCGPFVLAFGLSTRVAGGSAPGLRARLRALLPVHLSHNAGRILAFTLLGAVFGWIGAFVDTVARLTGVEAAAGLVGGAAMLAWAVDEVRTGHGGGFMERWSLLRAPALQRRLRQTLGRRDPWGAFLSGGLLGLHPCGLLYIMLLSAAATGRAVSGGLVLLAFGVGTVPALLTVATAGTLGGARLRGRAFSYLAAALIGASGLLFALRGMAVNGWIPEVNPWLF